VAKGGSSSVVIPKGSKIDATDPSGFMACPAGTTGNNPANTLCNDCPIGTSSTPGATTCQACDKGKFNNNNGGTCRNCLIETFQDQSAGTSCIACPTGWQQPNQGSSTCLSLNWKSINSCKDTEYLNNTATDAALWECEPCPTGGDCAGPIAWTHIPPKFGWWTIPFEDRDPKHQHQVFAECLFAPACLGGVNLILKSRHPEAATSSLNHNMSCNMTLGFRNTSRLCHTCATAFKRQGTNRCAECPKNQGDNWGLMLLGFVIVVCVLVFLVGGAINDAGKQTLSASIQKILVNYLQVVTLFNAFPLRWPAELEFLFEAQGAMSTLGEHLVNLDCIMTSPSAAEVYYSKQQFFAAMPFIVVVISFGVWYVYGRTKQKSFFDKRGDRNETTTKDKFVVTVTTVLYLLYPTLCKNTFGLFDCKTIGAQAYLKIDLEEKCYQGRHQTMMLLLGVGQLIVYIVGLPLIVLIFLRRNRESLHTYVSQARYGLFYGSYKVDRFFWETVITGRKVSVVMLSVFGPELGPELQAQVALLLILICIVFEIHGDPYLMETPKHQILGRLELSALMIEWGTMWSGLVIFQMDDSKPSDKSFAITLTIAVIVTNTIMLICFVVQFIRAKIQEQKEAARLAAPKPKKNKNTSFLSAGFSAIRKRFGGSGGDVELTSYENPMLDEGVKDDSSKKKRRLSSRELMSQMSSQHLQTNTQATEEGEGEGEEKDGQEGEEGGEGGEGEGEEVVTVTLGVHPMHAARGGGAPETATRNAARARWNILKQATRTPRTFRKIGKQRMKRLSKVMKARQNESGGGGGDGGDDSMGGEDEEMKTELKVETAVPIHVNATAGQTQWLSDEDQEDGTILVLEEQGEKY